MNTGVYEIVNKVNGKRYLGSAVNIAGRWSVHRHDLNRGMHHSAYLQRSWSKHGEANFEFRKLIICAKDDLLMYEQIALDSLRPEYNICNVAGNCIGVKHTKESSAKKSERSKAMWEQRRRSGQDFDQLSKQGRAKVNAANVGNKHRLGKTHSEEVRARISASMRAARDKVVAANVAAWARKKQRGYVVSDVARRKLSAAGMGRPVSSETRAKIGAANRKAIPPC